MHFAFTDQQTEFRDAVRQVLAKECTTDDLRAAYEAPAARTARWATLAELGVVGLAVPEDHGGLGLGLVDLVPAARGGRTGGPARAAGRDDRPGRPAAGRAGRAAERTAPVRRPSAPWLAAAWPRSPWPWPAVGTVPGHRVPTPVAGADGADLLVLCRGRGGRPGDPRSVRGRRVR